MFYLESLNKEDKDSSLLNREIKLSSGMDLIWSWYGAGMALVKSLTFTITKK
jgi:hypothetical protein